MGSEELDEDTALIVAAIETAIKGAIAPVVGRVRELETVAGGLGSLGARLDAIEAREPVQGPPGPPGPPGPAGVDGAPGLTYAGVYVAGKAYGRGDCVTFGGSLWHCNGETIARPGDGAREWSLVVKRGRDGAR